MISDAGGCWSYLGSIQTAEEGQRISISDGCYGRGTTLHEFMHALGIDHEQNRPDRENHVYLDWPNVDHNKRHNFEILQSNEWIDTGHAYEYNSVMHYDGYDFAIDVNKPVMTKIVDGKKTDQVVRSQRIRPTTTDTAQICELYGCEVCYHLHLRFNLLFIITGFLWQRTLDMQK